MRTPTLTETAVIERFAYRTPLVRETATAVSFYISLHDLEGLTVTSIVELNGAVEVTFTGVDVIAGRVTMLHVEDGTTVEEIILDHNLGR